MSQSSSSPGLGKLLREAAWWAAVLLLAIVAYGGGKEIRRTLQFSDSRAGAGGPVTTDAATAEKPAARSHPAGITGLSPEEKLQRLKRILAGTPDLDYDPEAQAELSALLATLSSAELATVWAGREQAAYPGGSLNFRIMEAWLNRDPAAALVAMGRTRETVVGSLVSYSWQTWCLDHCTQALALLDSPDFPAEMAGSRDWLRQRCVASQLGRNFDVVAQQYSHLSATEATKLLVSLEGDVWQTPMLEKKLMQLAVTAERPVDQEQLQLQHLALLRDSPATAGEYLDSLSLTGAARTTAEAMVAAGQGLEASGAWLAAHPEVQELPSSLNTRMADWLGSDSQISETLKWLNEQPQGRPRDLLALAAVTPLIRRNDEEHANGIISRISDPALQQEAQARFDAMKKLQQENGGS